MQESVCFVVRKVIPLAFLMQSLFILLFAFHFLLMVQRAKLSVSNTLGALWEYWKSFGLLFYATVQTPEVSITPWWVCYHSVLV